MTFFGGRGGVGDGVEPGLGQGARLRAPKGPAKNHDREAKGERTKKQPLWVRKGKKIVSAGPTANRPKKERHQHRG